MEGLKIISSASVGSCCILLMAYKHVCNGYVILSFAASRVCMCTKSIAGYDFGAGQLLLPESFQSRNCLRLMALM